jgi:hypothetical protein
MLLNEAEIVWLRHINGIIVKGLTEKKANLMTTNILDVDDLCDHDSL